MKKKSITLDQLTGQGECFLEIEPHDNGDIYITFRGQDEQGRFYTVRAQSLGVFGGMRNEKAHRALLKFYNMIK